jgi:hypothetical protein
MDVEECSSHHTAPDIHHAVIHYVHYKVVIFTHVIFVMFHAIQLHLLYTLTA